MSDHTCSKRRYNEIRNVIRCNVVKSYNKLIHQFYCEICKTTKKYYLIKDNKSKLKDCKCAMLR